MIFRAAKDWRKRRERREQRQVEEWRGVGQLLHQGRPLGEVPYLITVLQTFIVSGGLGPAKPDEEIPGSKDLQFIIDHGRIDLWKFNGVVLTLRLEDRRHVAVFHNGHRFVAAGPVQGP
jgi:hypothetical protein